MKDIKEYMTKFVDISKLKYKKKPNSSINHIFNIDCIEGMKHINDNSIDMIFTDPPYGKDGIYLYEKIAKEGKRILKDGGIAVFYASDYWIDKIFVDCLKHLDYFYLFHRINNRGNASIFPRKVFAGGKSILVFSKGKPKTFTWINNVISDKSLEKDLHLKNWQQSISDATKFIEAYSNKNDLILDPVIGSGTTAIACLENNRNFIGFEIDKEQYDIAIDRINKWKKGVKK